VLRRRRQPDRGPYPALNAGPQVMRLFDHPALEAGHPLRRHIAYRLERPG
jgi:hypothetical protein